MLRYKTRGTAERLIVNIPYYEDCLYISNDGSTVSGVCDTKYCLFDEETVYLSNGYQSVEATASAVTSVMQGYVEIKEPIYPQSFSIGDDISGQYIEFNGRYFFSQVTNYGNEANNSDMNPQINEGEIAFYSNGYEPIKVSDGYLKRRIYIYDGIFEYNGLIYNDGEEFSLDFDVKECTDNGSDYGNITKFQTIYFDDNKIGEVHLFHPYRNVTKFLFNVAEASTLPIDRIKQVTIQDDGSYVASEGGIYLYITFTQKVDLIAGEGIHYDGNLPFNELIEVVEDVPDEQYHVFLNDRRYESVNNVTYYIKEIDGNNNEENGYDLKFTNESDSDVNGYPLVAKVNLNDIPLYFFVNESKTSAVRFVGENGEITTVTYEVHQKPTFIIDDEYYPIVKEKNFQSGTTTPESEYSTYIHYNSPLEGNLVVLEVISDKTVVCASKTNYSLTTYDNIIPITQHIARNYNRFTFTIENGVLKKPSLEDFVFNKPDDDFDEYDVSNDEAFPNVDISNQPIRIYKNGMYMNFTLHLHNDMGTNLMQEDVVTNQFYNVERANSINSIIDMEKDIYHPIIVNGNNKIDVSKIVFNLHLRTRDMNTWEVNEDDGNERTVGLTNWFCMDYPYYFRNDNTRTRDGISYYNGTTIPDIDWINFDEQRDSAYTEIHNEIIDSGMNIFEMSDLLGFLKFTDDDVFYQKSKLANTFIRLSFYDSPDPKTQSLLYYSTIYMDEGELFKKYLENTKTRDGKEFTKVTNLSIVNSGDTLQLDFQRTSGDTTNSISVDREYTPLYNEISEKLIPSDYEDKRLSCRFNVDNRYVTDDSSDGFYLYLYRDYSLPFTPRSVYMKVELNHAGLGRTIPFMYPRKFKLEDGTELDHLTLSHGIVGEGETAIKYEVDSNNPYRVLKFSNGANEAINIQSELCQDISDFREGYDLKDIYYQEYIELKVVYDAERSKYVYYLPFDVLDNKNANNLPYRENTMILNLWEIKIKNEEINE